MYNTIPMSKIQKFEYITHQLIDWYKSNNKTIDKNDFSKLKVLKLHFFIEDSFREPTISSDVRYKIVELFKENNLVIALPQVKIKNDLTKE